VSTKRQLPPTPNNWDTSLWKPNILHQDIWISNVNTYINKQTEKHSQIHFHFKGPHTTGIAKINNIG